MRRPDARTSDGAAAFAERLERVRAQAEGAISGIVALSPRGRRSLIDEVTLRRLQDTYRLRIEVELETAGLLWRTAELVRGVGELLQALSGLRGPRPPSPRARRSGLAGRAGTERRNGGAQSPVRGSGAGAPPAVQAARRRAA